MAHRAAAVGAGEQVDGVVGGGFDVAGFHEKTVYIVFDNFGDATDVGGDDRDFAGHGFESGEAEGFQLRGKQEEVGAREFGVDLILLAQEVDIFL